MSKLSLIGLGKSRGPVSAVAGVLCPCAWERARLGEYGEYVVRAEGLEMRLRVTASPDDMHAVGEDVWMEIDPSRIAPVPEPAHP